MPGSASGAPARLAVGRIGRAHGLRGEVRVALTTNRTERPSSSRANASSGSPTLAPTAATGWSASRASPTGTPRPS
ncbi:MAG: hypothetical protein KJ056_12850 [Acidimicrobiia bacterium]|nr:hypothetical protein [Acidimicrobiia bacterium]